jgi:hypothetical protein
MDNSALAENRSPAAGLSWLPQKQKDRKNESNFVIAVETG